MPTHRFGILLIGGVALSLPAFSQGIAGFQGPSVLSRGAGSIGNRSGRAVGIRFFAAVNAVVDNGIIPISVDSSGKIPTIGNLYGVEASIGAYGSKSFRRSQLGLDYKGSYRHYSDGTYFDGSDQSLALGYSAQPSKRLQVNLRGTGSSTSRGLGAFSAISVADAESIENPTALLFDNRTNSLQGSADFGYQKTSRLVFVVGGDGYTVRRQSSALIGVNGYSLRGGTQYQYSRPLALTVNYTFTHYDFPRAFGESDVHGVDVGLVRRMSRRWNLALSGGAYRAETQGLQRIGLDPAIAALLGTGSVIQAFYRVTTQPSYHALLTGTYRLASITFAAARAVNPGNGVYLTSQSENYTGSYSFTGIRNASFGASAGYSKLSSLGQSLGGYGQYTGGLNANYQVWRFTSVSARYDYRQSAIDLVGFKRTSNRLTIGLTFSPSEVPVSWF